MAPIAPPRAGAPRDTQAKAVGGRKEEVMVVGEAGEEAARRPPESDRCSCTTWRCLSFALACLLVAVSTAIPENVLGGRACMHELHGLQPAWQSVLCAMCVQIPAA